MLFYLMVLFLALWAIGLSFGVPAHLVNLLLLGVAVLLAFEVLQRARRSA